MSELSEGLRGYVDGAAAPISIDEVQRSNDRGGGARPPKRRRQLALFAAAVVLAVLGGLLWTNRPSTQRVHTIAPPPSDGSSHQAVAIQGESMVLLDTDDGHVIKRLVAAPALARSSPTLSVSPDGSTVWFANAEASSAATCPAPSPNSIDTVESIDIRTGKVRMLGPGQQPAVSPDGRFLAYVRPPLGVCFPENFSVLVVRDLRTGHDQRWSLTGDSEITNPRWLSDSRHLVVTRDSSDSLLMDTHDPDGLAHAVKQPQQDGTILLGVRGNTDQLLIAKYDQGANRPGGMAIGTISPTTGEQTRFLFQLPGSPPPDAIRGSSDMTGDHILATVGQRLYRWSVGDRTPTAIADDVWAIAWISDVSSPGAPSTTTPRRTTAIEAAFDGHWWVPVEVLAGDETLPVFWPGGGAPPDTWIAFGPATGLFNANAVCFGHSGYVTIRSTTLTLTRVQAVGTLAGCFDHAQTGTRGPIAALQQVLVPNVPMRWTIVAGRLHLRTANGETVVFRSQPSPNERTK